MNPYLGKWALNCFGQDSKSEPSKHTLRLQDLTRLLVKGHDDLKAQRHTAGADAQLHRLLIIELIGLVKESQSALLSV